ncbi:MAG: nicotinate (nicotinamide) nucleotide adenylyltransferase [Pelagibacteraceae bacterium]
MLKSTNKYIGILGGSFDPPHEGHVKISYVSCKKLKLKKLHWVITKKNPFKKKSFFSLNERIKKCKKITKKNKKIKIHFLEDKFKSNKTIDILKFFIKKNVKSNYYLIIGSDNLINFHKWKRWKLILKMCKLVIFSRKGFEKEAKKSQVMKYLKKKEFIYIKNNKIDISSSQLRKFYLK